MTSNQMPTVNAEHDIYTDFIDTIAAAGFLPIDDEAAPSWGFRFGDGVRFESDGYTFARIEDETAYVVATDWNGVVYADARFSVSTRHGWAIFAAALLAVVAS